MIFPKHYSLKKDADAHFEIHDARDDKTFKVSKKDLHPANQIKIMKLQKFAEGGDVEEDDAPSTSSEEETIASPQPEAEALPQVDPVAQMSNPQSWHAPMLPQDQQPSPDLPQVTGAEGQIATPQAQPQVGAQSQYAMPGMDQMAQGLRQAAAARQAGTNAQDDALRSYEQKEAVRQVQYNQNIDKINEEQSKFQKQLMDGKVDPKRYFNNMSTGQRVSTAIAMILGGIGAGLTKGPNLAMQMINKAVDDDISAQKADLGKTNTLLSMNMQKFHNLQSAEAATRLHYNTILQHQLQIAQNKATNGISAAALKMQEGQLNNQNALYKQKLALQGVQAQALGANPSGEGGLPVGGEPGQLLLDPKYRENRVVANGRAYQANDKESAATARHVETLAGPIVSGINRLKQLADDSKTRFAGSPENLEAHSIMSNLVPSMTLLSGAQVGAKRFSKEDMEMQAHRFQDPTRFDESLGAIKNDATLKGLEEEVESVRSNNLMGYKGGSSIKSFQPLGGGKLPLNK